MPLQLKRGLLIVTAVIGAAAAVTLVLAIESKRDTYPFQKTRAGGRSPSTWQADKFNPQPATPLVVTSSGELVAFRIATDSGDFDFTIDAGIDSTLGIVIADDAAYLEASRAKTTTTASTSGVDREYANFDPQHCDRWRAGPYRGQCGLRLISKRREYDFVLDARNAAAFGSNLHEVAHAIR